MGAPPDFIRATIKSFIYINTDKLQGLALTYGRYSRIFARSARGLKGLDM